MSESQQLWLIPFFPLVGFLLNATLGRRWNKPLINTFAIGSVLLSFFWVSKVLSGLGQLETVYIERYFTWITSGDFRVGFDLSVDRLTSVMLLVVTGIGSLIHIYAIGYMDHEDGYWRFFAYLNLFMFFMLVLVLANNFLLLFVGWEGVGLCSYLLIGFYIREKFAGDAGKKAFIVNRIGDFGFALALFLMFLTFRSLDFQPVFEKAASMPVETTAGILTAIALLMLVGACGKSAQIPLYVWLPDAMAGPTPVSALIHAATMVTAGVYLVARSNAIFNQAPIAMETVAIVGALTAFFAATMGLAQFDIKKVFAYSTVSQLGYMFLGLGVGAYSAGIFHVVTHAFFKALLFLGAGSVILACHHEQDLRQMGGLRKKLPVTFWSLVAAWLAISGVPFLSGFYSKDAILLAVWEHSRPLFWIGLITAVITAFYVSRAMFLTFWGEYRGYAHPHESPGTMTIPLAILALLSIGGGNFPVMDWIRPVVEPQGHAEHSHDPLAATLLYVPFLLGIGLAYVFYVASPQIPERLAARFPGLYQLLYHKYFVDEVYDVAIVHPIEQGSRQLLWRGVDAGLIDGLVNGVGGVARWLGGGLRQLQGGNIRSYATWVALGAVLLILVMGASSVSAAGGSR